MPDIRQTTDWIDTFVRANEDPIQPPWQQTTSLRQPAQLRLNLFTHRTGHGFSGGESYYSGGDPWDGDDAEIFGYRQDAGGGAAGLFWSISLWADVGASVAASGYRARREESSGGSGHIIYRWDAGAVTVIGSVYDNNVYHMMLLRRKGNMVELWGASPSDLETWNLLADAEDTTYMTGLRGGLGAGDNSDSFITGWLSFGGGPSRGVTPLPQYIRRPHRRGGLWVP